MFRKRLIKTKSSKKVLQLIKLLVHFISLFVFMFILFLNIIYLSFILILLLYCTVKSAIPPFPISETVQLLQNVT